LQERRRRTMSLRKILWSILAGASMSLMGGCDEDRSPGDASTEDTGGEEEELIPVEYGPPSP
jgi:hypothetical protein